MHYRNSILSDQVTGSSESKTELKIPPIPENPIFLCFEMCSVCITGGYPKLHFIREVKAHVQMLYCITLFQIDF